MHRNFNQKIFASGGSGKSYVLDTVYKDTKAEYGLIYDSVMKTASGNEGLLRKVIDLDHLPFIAAVMTPPSVAALQNLRRSAKQAVRRLVPLKVLASGHFGFQQTFAKETVELAKRLGVPIRYIFNDGKNTPKDITFEEYKAAVYNNSADIENIIRTTSYEELEKNPLGLNYDTRTADALEGNPIEEIDTRTPGGEQSIDGSNSRSNEGRNPEGERGTVPGSASSETGRESAEKLDSPVGPAPPKDKPITLVFGGSYSPIHTGHIDAALAAVKAAETQGYTVERILIAPVADTLLQAKNAKKGLPPEDFIPLTNRAEMARMLVSELGHNIEVTEEPSIEAENFKPTKEEPKLNRTQLANWARNKYPETTIVNVSGADQTKDMSGAPAADALPAMFSGIEGSHKGYFYLAMPRDEESPDNKSSSAVRKSLKEGKGVPSGYMTPGAEAYYLGLVNKQNTEPSPVEDTDYGSVENPNTANLARAFAKHFNAKNGFTGIVEARKFAANLLGGKIETGSAITKKIDEAVEVGVVLAARKIVELSREFKQSAAETYQNLLDLYNRQPNLSSRTSTSIAQQAYSTPAPLAYIASRLAGINENTSVYEPTAGNGMLLIEANPQKTSANELNPDRAANLHTVMSGVGVTNEDASRAAFAQNVDVVIENPPFGVVKDENEVTKTFQINDQYSTNEIDHAIVFKSLEAMKDSGSAVLIVGGIQGTDEVRSDKYNKGAKRKFYYSLYNEYNVVDHFTVDGSLYAKQGAGYPVDVIVIRGRGQSNLELPAATVPLF